MNKDRKAGALGRLPMHPENTHPRVMLADFLDHPLVNVPSVIDYHSKVRNWPMYLNDQLGDCTCAGIGHMIQAFTAYASKEVDVPESAVLSLYERFGYTPGDPSTDQGANEQDVLQSMHDEGLAGHKYSAFAQVDVNNMEHVLAALYLFGTLYLGIACPASAQQQFENGEKWTYVPGSPIEGGHAITLQGKDEDGTLQIVTWGALQPMDQSFWDNYIEEAWVVITPDWMEANKETPTGLDLQGLMNEFRSLT